MSRLSHTTRTRLVVQLQVARRPLYTFISPPPPKPTHCRRQWRGHSKGVCNHSRNRKAQNQHPPKLRRAWSGLTQTHMLQTLKLWRRLAFTSLRTRMTSTTSGASCVRRSWADGIRTIIRSKSTSTSHPNVRGLLRDVLWSSTWIRTESRSCSPRIDRCQADILNMKLFN